MSLDKVYSGSKGVMIISMTVMTNMEERVQAPGAYVTWHESLAVAPASSLLDN